MKDRYFQQVKLPEVGLEGQGRLRRSRVLIIGMGGLGCAVAEYLARAGVGTLGLVDFDQVELTNLHRQILYREKDLGHAKATIAKRELLSTAPELECLTYPAKFSAEMAEDYDILLDCTDNFPTKYLINDVSLNLNVPFVYGSISRFEAQLALFHSSPCLRCVYPEDGQRLIPNCAENGVLGATVGIVGSFQALEALKWILHPEKCKTGQWILFELWDREFRQFSVQQRPDCLCVNPKSIELPSPKQEEHNMIYLDVRDDDEWRSGHIPNAIHWPVSRLVAGEFPEIDPNEEITVYCAHGIRSRNAVSLLKKKGFTNVKDLKNGIHGYDGKLTR